MARQRTPDGPPPPPAVQRLRLRYARRGRLRFSSSRDFARALERALRRARVPMAFSAGFHPHPKISYAGAAPTGTASEAEYLEISVTERVDTGALRDALDAALPEGLDVLEVVEAGPGSLPDRLEASAWELRFRDTPEPDLAAAVAAFLAREEVEVSRMFKRGERTFDARGPVVAMSTGDDVDPGTSVPCAILHMVVRHTTPAVRPDDVLTALRTVCSFAPSSPPLVTRLAQGPLDPGTARVADPLAADRDAAGPCRA